LAGNIVQVIVLLRVAQKARIGKVGRDKLGTAGYDVGSFAG
jgi:hypothetical protein